MGTIVELESLRKNDVVNYNNEYDIWSELGNVHHLRPPHSLFRVILLILQNKCHLYIFSCCCCVMLLLTGRHSYRVPAPAEYHQERRSNENWLQEWTTDRKSLLYQWLNTRNCFLNQSPFVCHVLYLGHYLPISFPLLPSHVCRKVSIQ